MVLISFPKIKIGTVAFNYVVIPALEALNRQIGSDYFPSAVSLLRILPLLSISLLFPNFVSVESVNQFYIAARN